MSILLSRVQLFEIKPLVIQWAYPLFLMGRLSKDHIHLLSGIVKCPVCGKSLVGSIIKSKNGKGGGYYRSIYYYFCRNNTKQNGRVCSFDRRINQEIIDGLVLRLLEQIQSYKEFEDALKATYGDQDTVEKTETYLQVLRRNLREAELTKDRIGAKLDGLNPLGKDYDKKYEKTSAKLDSMYDRIEELECLVSMCNERFQDALKRGDEAAMDFWHMRTRRFETQHGLEREIAACGAMLRCGVSDVNGKAYVNNASDMRGLSKISDMVLDILREEGFVENDKSRRI